MATLVLTRAVDPATVQQIVGAITGRGVVKKGFDPLLMSQLTTFVAKKFVRVTELFQK